MDDRRWAKRSFGFVIAALLVIALYFQVAGAVALISAHAPAQAGQLRTGEPDGRRPIGVALPLARQVPTELPHELDLSEKAATDGPSEIANMIQKVSETEFNIDRAALDSILTNELPLAHTTHVVPEQKDGKTLGVRLLGIRSDSLLGSLGIQNGDRLEKVNGFDLSSPEKALEAYAGLRTATQLSVQVTRQGEPLTIEYRIQ